MVGCWPPLSNTTSGGYAEVGIRPSGRDPAVGDLLLKGICSRPPSYLGGGEV